nr:hypothetical protein [Amylibacter sp.]
MNRFNSCLNGVVAGLCLTLGFAEGANARQRIPLSAAMAQCDTQSLRYSRQLADGAANTPSQYKLNRHYRTCVYAKSGQYPPSVKTPTGIRLSGSASVGIVVRD